MRRLACLLLVACASSRPAPRSAPQPLTGEDPTSVALQLMQLARAGDAKTLSSFVDWDFWGRLVRAQALAYGEGSLEVPPVEHLIATLTSVPAECDLRWDVGNDGGLRFDFPPPGVDEMTPEQAAESNAVHDELYKGNELVAWCAQSTGGVEDRDERFILLLLHQDGAWRIRAWGQVDTLPE